MKIPQTPPPFGCVFPELLRRKPDRAPDDLRAHMEALADTHSKARR